MKASVIGGGVIGAGWAARFITHGWDVSLYDPSTEAAERVQQVVESAKHSVQKLYEPKAPACGNLHLGSCLAEAIADADWVQESVPEVLELKRRVLAQIATPHDVVIASSTSGFKPSDLASGLDCRRQFLVAHPFNPVYLLPGVEVVAGVETDAEVQQTAVQILESIGMKATVVRSEIDAHIADRLLEALWREALWLVKDGVATTGDIDEIMTNGFGLRWAQMGLFENYRMAGGAGGMQHFLKQFGPALAWPWSRLTDVPELDNDLIGKIVEQSDKQASGRSITSLQAARDENLVAILIALKACDSAAGAVLNSYQSRIGS